MKEGLYIEVDKGVEGHSLSIMLFDEKGNGDGTRLAGPKPWGGAKTVHSFKIDMENIKEINTYGRRAYPGLYLCEPEKLMKARKEYEAWNNSINPDDKNELSFLNHGFCLLIKYKNELEAHIKQSEEQKP